MSLEAEEWRSERDLELWKESLDVTPLFKALIRLGADSSYMANSVQITDLGHGSFRLILEDAWTCDPLISKRMATRVEIVTKEYEISWLVAP